MQVKTLAFCAIAIAASAAEVSGGASAEVSGQKSIAQLQSFLARSRSSTEEERRAVLKAINADVPDKSGRFRTPRRKEKINRGDDFDWRAELARLAAKDDKRGGARPGLKDVMADVEAIRALAASKDASAGQAILEFGFTDAGLVYRDECGRYLRKMAPYSLPSLVMASADRKKDRSLRRYARYQLDRIDRQDPKKALAHASADPALELELVRAYGISKHRSAFAPLLALAEHAFGDIRSAARKSVMAYLTGRAPEAPKRKLVLPGGKLSDKEEPLWLNYRDLAEVELRRKHQEVFGERAPRRIELAALAEKLFTHFDTARVDRTAKAFTDLTALAQAGKWAEAVKGYDRLLAQNPDHPKKASMAPAYFEHAKALAEAGAWTEAAAAYSKAHGLNPQSEFARDALASHHYAVGKALEADGKDPSAAFRRAKVATPPGRRLSAQPDHERAEGTTWMLYAGIAGGGCAVILLILGLALRAR